MIRRFFAVLAVVAVAAPAVIADDADVAKGLENLIGVHRIANAIELKRSLAGTQSLALPPDPWGTPFKVEESILGYRIVSAGSDGKFEAPAPNTPGQFAGTAGDVVFDNGKLVRSNRNWLTARIEEGGMGARALAELRRAEIDYALMRVPVLQSLTGAKATAVVMRLVGEYIQQNKTAPPAEQSKDAWGTPLKITIAETGEYQIISAGADRQFNEASWPLAAAGDVNEDMIYENGRLSRHVVEADVLRNANITALAVPQPTDQSLKGTGRWVPIAPPISAPAVIERVDPAYPDEYRRARVGGVVIVEAAISETGTVENVALLKSVAPALDSAAMAAVRNWKFKPAVRDGQPVPVLFNLTVNFKLQ